MKYTMILIFGLTGTFLLGFWIGRIDPTAIVEVPKNNNLPEVAQTQTSPNVVLIIADDLGYSDLSSYGNKDIHTPNIDKLGKEGIRFSQAYSSAPICGPSRAAILTGRYQQRYGNEFMGYDRLDPAFNNTFLLDGVDNISYSNSFRGENVQLVQPSIEALQEFKIQTNAYSAEFGRSSGAVVNATIKSGSNTVRGSVYEFFRNDGLDANNYFSRLLGAPKPVRERNQFGGAAGGPLVKNRTFWFGDYEGLRDREGIPRVRQVPTAAEKAGLFDAAVFDPFTAGRPEFWVWSTVRSRSIPRRMWTSSTSATSLRPSTWSCRASIVAKTC